MKGMLQVRGLTVELLGAGPIVADVSFEVEQGKVVGVFGESGCGKTTLALALLGLLSPAQYRVRGSVRIRGRELIGLPEREMEPVRGALVSMIFQDPMLALNPVLRVSRQIREVTRAHGVRLDPEALLDMAGLPDPPRILRAYPHQLSGGERQRVHIAQALACKPSLVIADEPFTALDPVRVVELAALFRRLREKTGTSFLVISHSPGVLAGLADSVLVMQHGRIVEQGSPQRVFRSPEHPYTMSVIAAAQGIANRA
jgi:ABC-type glutathione transport system ATPase component